jgi:PAS domain S-box-containing protein/putative nucleotidyltransferase with HDIG domain
VTWSPSILIVDDEPRIRTSLERLLRAAGYTADQATCGKEACGQISAKHYDLLLLDLMMPDMDGLQVMEYVQQHSPRTLVIILTGFASADSAVDCLKKGAYDYLKKPFETEELTRRVEHALDQKRLQIEEEELHLQRDYFQQLFENSPDAIVLLDSEDHILKVNRSFEKLFQYANAEIEMRSLNDVIVPDTMLNEAEQLSRKAQSMGSVQKETQRRRKDGSLVDVAILGYPIQHKDRQIGVYGIYSDITQRKRSEEQLQRTLEKLRKAMGATISAMASTVEVRDPYTAGHQQRVANLARAIAQTIGLGNEEVDGIRMAGAIHDLGKITVPAEILSKPGRITDIEFSLIKTHPLIAYEILKEIDFPWPVAQIVYQHHERLDGSGYPQGLAGDKIRLEAQILSVADAVEAIASHRPYRPALGLDKALEWIVEKRGIYYDARVVDACRSLFLEKKFSFDND